MTVNGYSGKTFFLSAARVFFIVFFLAVANSGCGTLPNGRGWGQDATLSPGWERIQHAAWNAATAPETWAPAAGALAFQIDHADTKVSEWAAKNTPIFGSQQNADEMSTALLDASAVVWVASGIAAPSGNSTGDWLEAKAKGFGIEAGAGVVTLGTVDVLKTTVHRMRPNGADDQSFPSGHSTGAAFFSTVASRNIETLSWSQGATTAAQIGLGALTAATAWARIEANQHYPSDVLAGIAIGHFFGAFLTDAFLGLDNPRHLSLLVEPSRAGGIAMLQFNFE
ncbi:MAG TPA: phosphatase PAP2 family protein [Nitrospirota bacterium]|nr:phosphatase PAP2 family protein [Nitrospirota bacterium]